MTNLIYIFSIFLAPMAATASEMKIENLKPTEIEISEDSVLHMNATDQTVEEFYLRSKPDFFSPIEIECILHSYVDAPPLSEILLQKGRRLLAQTEYSKTKIYLNTNDNGKLRNIATISCAPVGGSKSMSLSDVDLFSLLKSFGISARAAEKATILKPVPIRYSPSPEADKEDESNGAAITSAI